MVRVLYFSRIHQTIRITPAMEAGVTRSVWTLGELLVYNEAALKQAAL